MIDWHRLFGLALIDFFTGSPFGVEVEKDLSLKQQLLDVVIIRKQPGEFQVRLPDGLHPLAAHNLLTYKSLREALDDWTLDELIAYYVNYRKQVSPSLKALLPTEDFQLYAVSTRFPQKLADMVPLEALQTGVYQVMWGTHQIRLIVLSEIPEGEQNALWNLFSTIQENVVAGAARYREQAGDVSAIINRLFENYQLEGLVMPYTMQDFRREVAKRYLPQLSIEERLEGLAPEEILKRFPAEDILKQLPVEEVQAYLDKLRKPQQSEKDNADESC